MVRLHVGLVLALMMFAGAGAGAEQELETATASDDNGRAAAWRELRVAKRARSVEAEGSWFNRLILDFESGKRPRLLNFNYKGFFPQITTINKDSRTSFGVRFWQPDIGRSDIDVHATALYSTRNYQFYDIQLGSLQHAGIELPQRSTRGDDVFELGGLPRRQSYSRLILYGSLRYRDYPEEDFFGTGTESSLESESNYALTERLTELVAGWQLSRRVAWTVRAGYLEPEIGRGQDETVPTTQDLFDDSTAPGLARQPDFVRFSSQLFVDFRDIALNPHKGGMAALSYTHFDERGGDEFRFDRWAIDARAYLPLGSVQRVLALRLFASTDEADEASRVPFYLQEVLGGKRTLRGYESFRFRGPHVLSLQAEYRWEAIPEIELAMFADAGKITERREDLGLEDMRTSYGFGIRLKLPQRVVARFDLAHSREGTRFIFNTGGSF